MKTAKMAKTVVTMRKLKLVGTTKTQETAKTEKKVETAKKVQPRRNGENDGNCGNGVNGEKR